jgi:flagellar M-ring protein FliF
VEKSYEDSISGMLERVVGAGNAVVRVTADLNLDKLTEQSELYDPTQQVVRSEQTVESTNTAAEAANGGVTGVAGNTPGGPAAGAPGGTNSNEARNETTTNYEISKTVRSLSKQGGEVRKLSVAVLVSGKAAPAAAGADAAATPAAYTPLSDDEKTRIRTLVETAIGYDAARGDKVEIVDMPFTPTAEPPAVAEPFMTKAQIMSLGQYGLIVIALIVVAMMVVKPALTTLNTALASGASNGLLPSMAPGLGPMGGAAPMPDGGAGEENSMIDIRSVQGRVRESAVKKVNEIIDQYPEESLGVVRNWMGGSPTTDNS